MRQVAEFGFIGGLTITAVSTAVMLGGSAAVLVLDKCNKHSPKLDAAVETAAQTALISALGTMSCLAILMLDGPVEEYEYDDDYGQE